MTGMPSNASQTHDEPSARILRRAFQAQFVIGIIATAIAFTLRGRIASQSVALGALFAVLHLASVAQSVRATYGEEATPARFFVMLRSLRFLTVLAGAALVLVAHWATPLGFLFGYALLVIAIAVAPLLARASDGP